MAKLFYTEATRLASSALFGGGGVDSIWEAPIRLAPTLPMVYAPHIQMCLVAVWLQTVSCNTDVDACCLINEEGGSTLCVLQQAQPFQ